jgi:hypothetical protein
MKFLTDAEIESIKPEAKATHRKAGPIHGYTLRVSPQGTKTWLLFYNLDGVSRTLRAPKPS